MLHNWYHCYWPRYRQRQHRRCLSVRCDILTATGPGYSFGESVVGNPGSAPAGSANWREFAGPRRDKEA